MVYIISGAVYAYCSVSTYECAQVWWQAPSADAYYAKTESTDVHQFQFPMQYVSAGCENHERLLQICRCMDKSDVISRFRRICSLSIEVSWVTKWLSSCRGRRREVWKVTYADKGRIVLMLAVQVLITCSQLRWPAILVVRRGSSFSLDAKSSAVEEAASHPSQQSLGSASHPHWYPDLEL